MKKIVSIFAILLLLFNGIGAAYGGWLLITDPSGEKLQLPLSVLAHTPFRNFLLPGVVLFYVNGICSFVVLAQVLVKSPGFPLLVFLEGLLLCGWIAIEILWTRVFHPLQAIMATVGFLLIGCGFALRRSPPKKHPAQNALQKQSPVCN